MFLLPGAAIEAAERALFAEGFETIVLRGDLLRRESLLQCARPVVFGWFRDSRRCGGALDAEVKRELQEERARANRL